MTRRRTSTTRRRTLIAAALLAAVVVPGTGCSVERDRETERCIEEAREDGAEIAEAQQACMGTD